MLTNMAFLFAVSAEEVLYGYGPLGVGVVAISIFAMKMFSIIMKDRDKAIEDRDQIVEDLFTKVLPAIARNTEVLEKRQLLDEQLIETLKHSNDLREETRLAFEASKRAFDEFRRTSDRLRESFEKTVEKLIEHGYRGPRTGGV